MSETPRETTDGGLLPAGVEEQRLEEPARSRRPLLKSAALVLAGLIIGGGTMAAVQAVADDDEPHRDPGGEAAGRRFAPGEVPGGPVGQPGGGLGGGPGGVAGELHLQGTVTEVTADSVTLETADGTDTYALTETSLIVRDGQPATADELAVDDPVLVHVVPAPGGDLVVERIFAGTLPGFGQDDDDSDDARSSSTT